MNNETCFSKRNFSNGERRPKADQRRLRGSGVLLSNARTGLSQEIGAWHDPQQFQRITAPLSETSIKTGRLTVSAGRTAARLQTCRSPAHGIPGTARQRSRAGCNKSSNCTRQTAEFRTHQPDALQVQMAFRVRNTIFL